MASYAASPTSAPAATASTENGAAKATEQRPVQVRAPARPLPSLKIRFLRLGFGRRFHIGRCV